MALTFQTEVSDGVRTTYPVSFDFLSQAYVYVYVGDHAGYQVQVSYIWASSTTIEVTNLAELPAGTEFFIRRVVPRDDLIYTFADKSIRGALVDAENTHILHLVQEFIDGFVSLGELQSFFTDIDMNNNRITNLADAIDPQDAVNLHTAETIAATAKGANFVQEEVPTIGLFQGARWYKPSIPTTYVFYVNPDNAHGQWIEEDSVGDDASAANITMESEAFTVEQKLLELADRLSAGGL